MALQMASTHHIAHFDPEDLEVPHCYRDRSDGYRHVSLVNRAAGSVHISKGVCELSSGGHLSPHIHSFEEGFYVLDGSVRLMLADRSYELSAGHYGVVPVGVTHAWFGSGSQPGRWLEVCSPQHTVDGRSDTFFVESSLVQQDRADVPDFRDPRTRWLGYWSTDPSQVDDQSLMGLTGGMDIQVGFGRTGGSDTSVYIKKLIDPALGAYLTQLIMCDFRGTVTLGGDAEGAEDPWHDHCFEETFFLLEGEMDGLIAGERYHIVAGDCVWVGVGTPHHWIITTERCLWLEAQVPQPPIRHTYRFSAPWKHLGETVRDGRQAGAL